jgi:hypothetical protein
MRRKKDFPVHGAEGAFFQTGNVPDFRRRKAAAREGG